MTKDEVMEALEAFGNPGTKKVLGNHGYREPFFGVKVGDMKKLQKKIKKDYALSLELWDTGNADAMYFAGLIADEKQMTRENLQKWANEAYCYSLAEYTVAWITSESDHGFDLGMQWIESDEALIATAGWSTLASLASITPDEELDFDTYSALLERAEKEVHTAPNRVRYVMNGFIIAVGAYMADLTEKAMEIGQRVGKVEVFMGKTACKVPLAAPYIQKIVDKGRVGKKRKMARC
ncbi:MAG: DNA alkylation repair protein [Bacteroidota bacterium]